MLANVQGAFDLQTPRLHLRPIVEGDIDALVALDSDPEVMRYVGGEPNPRRLYETTLMGRMTAWAGEPIGFFAAHLKQADPPGEFIGWFHLRPSVAEASILELGYRLRRAVWGQGLATEGSLALLRRAFFELDQPRVDACAMPENGGSIAVMKKCGMAYAGRFTHPRAPLEVVRYMVDRDTFEALHGRTA